MPPRAAIRRLGDTVEQRKRTLMDQMAAMTGTDKDDETTNFQKTAEGRASMDGDARGRGEQATTTKSARERTVGTVAGKADKVAIGDKMVEETDAEKAVAPRGAPAVTETGTDSLRDLVVNVEVDGEPQLPMIQLLKAVDNTCGRVIGCRNKGSNKWEITMSNPRGKERLLDGFKIGERRVIATEVSRDTRIVSFLNLPLYITDNQIFEKLTLWGMEPVSPIKKRKWAGTEVLDGTRFLKVRFTDNVSSLPYSAKFYTIEGVEYFRVL